MKIVTSGMMKDMEDSANQSGLSYAQMMENAGKAVSDAILRMETGQNHCLFLCGKGNNAGDALVAARHLAEHRYTVFVIFLLGTEELSVLAKANLDKLNRDVVHVYESPLPKEQLSYLIPTCDVIIDGVFGTGFAKKELPEAVQQTFRITNEAKSLKIALDIPSGIVCDSGFYAQDSFAADITYAFAALKPAHLLKGSKQFCGKIKLTNIGINVTDEMLEHEDAVEMLDEEMVDLLLPQRPEDSNKGTFGKLLIVGGSYAMPGAVVLASQAALRCGVGIVQAAIPKSIMNVVGSHLFEAIYLPLPETEQGSIAQDAIDEILGSLADKKAVLVGMGLGRHQDAIELMKQLVQRCTLPMIIDGDGLNCLAENIDILRQSHAPIILTPHMMEMSRMIGLPVEEVKENRFFHAREFARKYQITLVLKDSNTLITTPEGKQLMNDNGNSGLAKGGSGDVLAGMIGSFVAQGIDVNHAGVLGVYLHAMAGDIAAEKWTAYAVLPHDIQRILGDVFHEVLKY